MKILADEHVSPTMVRLIRELLISPGFEIISPHDNGTRGTDDVSLITQFAKDGGHAILTADQGFIRRAHQVMAVCDTGLQVIHLHSKWANSPRNKQMALMSLWWPRIEETLKNGKPRQCWRVPSQLSETAEIVLLEVDFEKAKAEVTNGR